MAFLKYNEIMYCAGIPAASQAKLEAIRNNKNYGITITTTPNNIDLPESIWCREVLIGQACIFDENFFYDHTLEEIDDYIKKKSDNNFVYIEFSYKELGKDEKWFKEQCRDLQNNLLKIKRELLLEWTRSSDIAVYSEEQLEAISQHIKEPVSKIRLLKYYTINLYRNDIDFKKVYIIGCDVAAKTDGDASTLCIMDPYTFEIVGEFRENKIDSEDFKHLIEELITRYFFNSLLVVENNIGQHILDYLMRTPVAKNVYYEYKTKLASKIEQSKKEIIHSKTKKKTVTYGVCTTKESRPLMLDILDNTVYESPELLATPNLYSDIKGLERNKQGKIEHGPGGHDDSLFAYLVARYVLVYGTNLARFMLPINGRTPEERNKRIARMSYSLSEANKSVTQKYNGIAKSIIEEDEKHNEELEISRSKNISFFNKILKIE
jgi:hypothetical protein